MEELAENAEEGDEEDKQSEQKLGRLNFKVFCQLNLKGFLVIILLSFCSLNTISIQIVFR